MITGNNILDTIILIGIFLGFLGGFYLILYLACKEGSEAIDGFVHFKVEDKEDNE